MSLAKMKSGETAQYKLNGHQFGVQYSATQSYGDDNRPVRGATVGRYIVTHPGGERTYHEHGPQADFGSAAHKRGASSQAKPLAAANAWGAMTATAAKRDASAGIFSDRRASVTTSTTGSMRGRHRA